ncbi:MAG TPA: DUF2336 domain-containing protein [Xanthobacteraceae bacterium]|jgi:uncharacterized protein (DUF2336 family)|nr:DUF2336 domain-containing protein [Xanthobacteraceae bacterium]
MTPAAQSLLSELDHALVKQPEPWRRDALRQMIDLFLSSAETCDNAQTDVFDEVLFRLIKKSDRTALAELATALAPVQKGPAKVLGTLARHSDSAISGPVIALSPSLRDKDLADIAEKAEPRMLMAIACRPKLGEVVTEVLLKRGNQDVKLRVINNKQAKLSESGFARLVIGLNGDKKLAAAISARSDVPPELRPWLVQTLEG